MAIIHPDRFKQSNPASSDGLFDWDAFTIIDGKSCFPRGITPMDIDANVEINWQHLMMESKDENKEIPEGQMKALRSLIGTGKVTLICIWGKLAPTSWRIETRSRFIVPIVLRFGGRLIKDGGDAWVLERQDVGCEKIFDFLQQWSAVVDNPRGWHG